MHNFEEELTCSICYSIFEDPRVLPCSHTFCRNCLENVLQMSSNFSIWRPLRFPLRCPNCRSIVEIPPSGIDSLPVNFALKSIIEKYRNEDHPEVATCNEHHRQPLNVYCLLDRKLVCGHCLTIGKHHGHPIDDLQSAYLKERETPRKLLEQLTDKHWSEVCLLLENLEKQKSQCENIIQEDKEILLQYFKRLSDELDNKKQDFLTTLDDVRIQIAAEYDPLIEEIKVIREEQLELMSLSTAVQEEESPLLFLENVEDLRLRVKTLKQKPLPDIKPFEIHTRIGQVMKDAALSTEVNQISEILTSKIKLISRGKLYSLHSEENGQSTEFWSFSPLRIIVLIILMLATAAAFSQYFLALINDVPFPCVMEGLHRVHLYFRNRWAMMVECLWHTSELFLEYLCRIAFPSA